MLFPIHRFHGIFHLVFLFLPTVVYLHLLVILILLLPFLGMTAMSTIALRKTDLDQVQLFEKTYFKSFQIHKLAVIYCFAKIMILTSIFYFNTYFASNTFFAHLPSISVASACKLLLNSSSL